MLSISFDFRREEKLNKLIDDDDENKSEGIDDVYGSEAIDDWKKKEDGWLVLVL